MIFTIKKETLLSVVRTVQKAIPGKSPLQLLECMLLEVCDSGQELTLTGNNLEIAIQCKAAAVVEDNGRTLVNARLFCELAEKLPEEDIYMHLDGNRLKISSGASEFSIPALPADAYPRPEMAEPQNTIEVDSLKELILRTTFAAGVDETNPVLNGILVSMGKGNLSATGGDGKRFALASVPVENLSTFKAIIPTKTLNELAKLIGPKEKINVGFVGSTVLFTKPGFAFSSRTIEGEYISVEKMIQKMDSKQEIRLKSTNDLAGALERVLLVSTQSNVPMDFTVITEKLILKAENEFGKIHETVAVKTGEITDISFRYNPKYLLDAVKAVKGEAAISISEKGMLLVIAENFKYIAAPVAKPKAATVSEKAAA